MKKTDIKGKSAEELTKLMNEKRATLRDLNFQVMAGQLKHVRSIRETRKDIARIKTAIAAQ